MGRVGAGGAATLIAKDIAAIGGVRNADFMRDPTSFRPASLASLGGLYQGKTATQATIIATKKIDPIKIAIDHSGKGPAQITIIDGRHRMTTAKNAGAKRIRAEVKIYGKRGGEKMWTGTIKI